MAAKGGNDAAPQLDKSGEGDLLKSGPARKSTNPNGKHSVSLREIYRNTTPREVWWFSLSVKLSNLQIVQLIT
jgi:hypothetical protein